VKHTISIIAFIIITITVITVIAIAFIPVAAMSSVHAAVAIGNGTRLLQMNPCAFALHSGLTIRDVPIAFLRRLNDRFTDVMALGRDVVLIQACERVADIPQNEDARDC
jgi:hypothetical protein